MDEKSQLAAKTVDRINAVGQFNYIVLTLEDIISPRRRNQPARYTDSAKKFLERWGQFLDETDTEVLSGINNPFAFINSSYGGEGFTQKSIGINTLKRTLGFIASGPDVYKYLEATFRECERDFEKYKSILDEIRQGIQDLPIEEFKERIKGGKAESLVYWTSRSGSGHEITRAVVSRLLDLDDESFLALNFQTLYSGLSGLDMQNPQHRATHKNELDDLSILLANKAIAILETMSAEQLLEDTNFTVLRSVFGIPTHETMDRWAFDETTGMSIINRLVDYVAGLNEESRSEVDPKNEKTFFLTKFSVDERLPRFTSDRKLVLLNGPEQTPENAARLAEELLRESTDLTAPLRCGTPELRLLKKFGYEEQLAQILENYAQRPARDFTFNCARFFDEIRHDTATTIREEEELALLPDIVDRETQGILEQKFIDSLLEQPSLCEYRFLDQVLKLASATRPQFTDEVVIPRLYEEVFGEPISKTNAVIAPPSATPKDFGL